jgi:hypothetical protein
VTRLKRLLPTELPDARTFFASGSIVDSVLDLGKMAPIDVQFAGNNFDELDKSAKELQRKDQPSAGGLANFHSAGI